MLQEENIEKKFTRLMHIMDELREKCPWDQKQTIQTLRPLTIEETYELGDAILEEDWNELKSELGDIMLHLLFYARIAKEKKQFTFGDVLTGISEKMITRHPHIYGDTKAETEEEVKLNWQKIKLEKEGKKSILSGVPQSLPAVVKATRIQEKAAHIGFEWENKADVWKKVEEEMNELLEAEKTGGQKHIEEEFGDVLFSLINYARFLKIDAEAALERTNKKFMNRFSFMEEEARKRNIHLENLSLEEMDSLWNKAKKEL
ncbi:MAG: nucleoside triphosphate pyrophosphohydrolase [Pseudopedobacter saltans]|uniref:Nucleoside triphosphate pyrophosphohydrolase n=1 Tax=Pseudopedobacter saltans TaxID=151895 RepID=A0A2W5EFJ5_9SPHI|nr:MAG: nucleoside triphosphate pyrophosphohydrolase [Pseudopedobacter saltans]